MVNLVAIRNGLLNLCENVVVVAVMKTLEFLANIPLLFGIRIEFACRRLRLHCFGRRGGCIRCCVRRLIVQRSTVSHVPPLLVASLLPSLPVHLVGHHVPTNQAFLLRSVAQNLVIAFFTGVFPYNL
ncbi:hypothetical protein KC345_g96 [Hortaea werneckii]|nr:hypothetical protein KC345_g96 [Hortaea werneckii]